MAETWATIFPMRLLPWCASKRPTLDYDEEMRSNLKCSVNALVSPLAAFCAPCLSSLTPQPGKALRQICTAALITALTCTYAACRHAGSAVIDNVMSMSMRMNMNMKVVSPFFKVVI